MSANDQTLTSQPEQSTATDAAMPANNTASASHKETVRMSKEKHDKRKENETAAVVASAATAGTLVSTSVDDTDSATTLPESQAQQVETDAEADIDDNTDVSDDEGGGEGEQQATPSWFERVKAWFKAQKGRGIFGHFVALIGALGTGIQNMNPLLFFIVPIFMAVFPAAAANPLAWIMAIVFGGFFSSLVNWFMNVYSVNFLKSLHESHPELFKQRIDERQPIRRAKPLRRLGLFMMVLVTSFAYGAMGAHEIISGAGGNYMDGVSFVGYGFGLTIWAALGMINYDALAEITSKSYAPQPAMESKVGVGFDGAGRVVGTIISVGNAIFLCLIFGASIFSILHGIGASIALAVGVASAVLLFGAFGTELVFYTLKMWDVVGRVFQAMSRQLYRGSLGLRLYKYFECSRQEGESDAGYDQRARTERRWLLHGRRYLEKTVQAQGDELETIYREYHHYLNPDKGVVYTIYQHYAGLAAEHKTYLPDVNNYGKRMNAFRFWLADGMKLLSKAEAGSLMRDFSGNPEKLFAEMLDHLLLSIHGEKWVKAGLQYLPKKERKDHTEKATKQLMLDLISVFTLEDATRLPLSQEQSLEEQQAESASAESDQQSSNEKSQAPNLNFFQRLWQRIGNKKHEDPAPDLNFYQWLKQHNDYKKYIVGRDRELQTGIAGIANVEDAAFYNRKGLREIGLDALIFGGAVGLLAIAVTTLMSTFGTPILLPLWIPFLVAGIPAMILSIAAGNTMVSNMLFDHEEGEFAQENHRTFARVMLLAAIFNGLVNTALVGFAPQEVFVALQVILPATAVLPPVLPFTVMAMLFGGLASIMMGVFFARSFVKQPAVQQGLDKLGEKASALRQALSERFTQFKNACRRLLGLPEAQADNLAHKVGTLVVEPSPNSSSKGRATEASNITAFKGPLFNLGNAAGDDSGARKEPKLTGDELYEGTGIDPLQPPTTTTA